MSGVLLDVTPFCLPKAGNSPAECDDAHFPRREEHYGATSSFRTAVADGATESSYSGVWAKLLVRAFGRDKLGDLTAAGALTWQQAVWAKVVNGKSLPWYAEEKAKQGAFSTLLGIEIHAATAKDDHRGRWSALAIGDSCVAQVRGEDLVVSFPLEASTQFSSRPHLLSSNVNANDDLESHVRRHEGEWRSSDTLYLMTDALAAWFLSQVEQGAKPWLRLRDFVSDTDDQELAFPQFVEALRDSRAMKNDDVTLVRVDLHSSHVVADASGL